MADCLTQTKLLDLTSGRDNDVVVLREDATVEIALRTLASHRVLSAPLVACGKSGAVGGASPRVSASASSSEDITDVLGFVDLRDILASFLKELDMKAIKGMKMLQRLRVLENKGSDFACKSLKDLKGSGGDGDFLHKGTAESATLREIIHNEFLYPRTKALQGGQNSYHVHRLALFNREGRITNIVSQSDIVRFLNANIDALGPLAHKTAAELGWADKPLIAVAPERPAIEAMEVMVEKGISAVAVVADGKLIGNFSVSELRTIMSEHFGSLALPVGEFLALEHGTEYSGYAVQGGGTGTGSAAPLQQPAVMPDTVDENTEAAATDPERHAVLASAGGRWAAERPARPPPPTPGSQVGQALVVVPPESTFRQVLAEIVRHRLHRLYVVGDGGVALGVVTLTDILRQVVDGPPE